MKIPYKRLSRTIGYGVLFLGIILITIFLVALGRGYHIDLATGQIYGGGLLLADSVPNRAQVVVNGKVYRDSTPSRISLRAGTYSVQLKKTGYRTWTKQIEVKTSQVTFIQYPLLIPNTITTSTLASLTNPSSFSQSPNRRLLAISTNGSTPEVEILTIGGSNLNVSYQLPADLINQHYQISGLAWASDNAHILIEVNNNQQPHFIVIDTTNPASTVDVTTVFGTTFSSLVFNDQNPTQLLGLSNGSLRRVDLSAQTVSASLADSFSNFIVSHGLVYGVQSLSDSKRIISIDNKNQLKTIVSSLPQTADYALTYLAYGDQRYLAVLSQSTHIVELYDPGITNTLVSQQFNTVSTASDFASPDGRYLVMQNGAVFASYDFDLKKLYRYSLSSNPQTALNWLDPTHLITEINNNVEVFEFDGGNQEVLTRAALGLPAFSSLDHKYVYSISTSTTTNNLQVSKLQP